MRKSTKKGFTIVELVIVVAVIAILAAVLIPTFTGIVNKARESSDIQLVRNLNTALATDKVLNGEHKTMQDAIDAAYEGGFVIEKLAASAKGNKLLWDSANGLFCYYDADAKGDQYVYAPEAELTVENPADYQYWEITDEVIPLDNQKFSIYYNGADIDTYPVKVGFDAGNAKVGAINYTKNANEQTVVIRTNSAATNLSIDAETDTVYHYGPVGTVNIAKIDMSCYYENGSAAYVKIEKGKVVATAGKIEVLFVNSTVATEVAVEKVSGAIATGYAADATVAAKLGTSFTVVAETAADAAGKEAVEVAVEAERKESFAEANYWIGVAADSFAGGSGTEADPYQIATAEQLSRLAYVLTTKDAAEYRSAYYKLTADIDLSQKCWIPISTEARKGDTAKMFAGHFDGNNKTISGMNSIGLSMTYITTNTNATTPANTDGEYPYGLFGSTYNATIKNVKMANVNIKVGTGALEADGVKRYVGDSVGALIGLAEGSITVDNVEIISGSVEGYDCVGGVLGRASNKVAGVVAISNVTNSATVNAVKQAGGIVAQIGSLTTKLTLTDLTNNAAVTTHFTDDYDDETEANKKNYYYAAGIAIGKCTALKDKTTSNLTNNGVLTNDYAPAKVVQTIDYVG